MSQILFINENFKVEVEVHEIPWIKIFTIDPFKEISLLPKEMRLELFEMVNFVESDMIEYFNPSKINIASFGNYVPHVHIHVQARFEDDSFFPEPTWGVKQREGKVRDFNIYFQGLSERLKQEF